MRCGGSLIFFAIRRTPTGKIMSVERNAEKIARQKPVLRGLNSYNAYDEAIDGGDNPAVPEPSSNQDCREDGQQTRNIVEMHTISMRPFCACMVILSRRVRR